MKKLILLVFTCSFFFSYTSYAQNKALDDATAFRLIDPRMRKTPFDFIDALAESNAPQSFIPYFHKYISSLNSGRVSKKVLMEEMAENVFPKHPQIAVIFALYLCLDPVWTGTLLEYIEVLNCLPKTQQYFKTMSAEQKKSAELDNILNGGNDEKNVVVLPQDIRAIVFSDGRILLTSYTYHDQLSNYSNTHRVLFKGESCQSDYMLLYNPNGGSCFGRFKDTGTGKLDVTFDNFEEHKNVELYVGSIYDHEGKCIGLKCGQYSSLAQLEEAIGKKNEEEHKAYEAAEEAKYKAEAKKNRDHLLATYGAKVVNALESRKIYVGMPLAVFDEMYFSANSRGDYYTYFDREKRIYVKKVSFRGFYKPGYRGIAHAELWFSHGKLIDGNVEWGN